VLKYDGSTYTPYQAGAGSAAKAGLAAWDGVDSIAGRIGIIDVRLEYECLVPADTPHVLVIGTSIEAGARGGDSGAAHYESWPGSAALRQGLMVTNLGVSSSVLTEWMPGTGWRYTRADLTTTPPDKIIIGGWTNDLAVGYATQQANYRTLLGNLRTMLPEAQVWGGTIIPYPTYSGGTYEGNRLLANTWVRLVPQGFAGVIDFDKALRVDPIATPAAAYSEYVSTYPHPDRMGYQRMAEAARFGR
jgi:hypothetical protein